MAIGALLDSIPCASPCFLISTATSWLLKPGLPALSTEHGLHGQTLIPIAFTMVDGRMRTLAPRAGNTVALGEGRTLLNPGSVGQPRDGDPRASYLILDLDAGTATWGRVAYD